MRPERANKGIVAAARHPWTLGCIVVLVIGVVACQQLSADKVRVRVRFSALPEAQSLTNVIAIAGGDKYRFGVLAPNDEQSVILAPGPADDRQLTLLYTLAGQAHAWEGPKVPMGRGYRIEVRISPENVGYVHCLLPCELPEQ